jgi:galactitol-specific phosphotransferase system IIB component
MHYKLTSEIIKRSEADYWDTAKNEWNFEYAYYSEDLQTCLCGHYPIKNVCEIHIRKNGNQTEVGNCCVNKFLGIDDGNKIFISIRRLKEDISKSMSPEVLEYLFDKQVLSEFEYSFYRDTIRKRKLSWKQLEIRERINQRLIDFTRHESNSNFARINLILKWAENNTWFSTDFVISLKENCERNGKLSEKQQAAIENIIKKMNIE